MSAVNEAARSDRERLDTFPHLLLHHARARGEHPATREKDMGIWQVASILPQITGIVIGALTLDALRSLPNHLGYSILMLITTLFFGLGTIFIYQVKGVR